jgi:hypothetical protein
VKINSLVEVSTRPTAFHFSLKPPHTWCWYWYTFQSGDQLVSGAGVECIGTARVKRSWKLQLGPASTYNWCIQIFSYLLCPFCPNYSLLPYSFSLFSSYSAMLLQMPCLFPLLWHTLLMHCLPTNCLKSMLFLHTYIPKITSQMFAHTTKLHKLHKMYTLHLKRCIAYAW